jgi:uncharacterized protein
MKLIFNLYIITIMTFTSNITGAQQNKSQQEINKQIISDGFTQWANGTGNFFDLLAEDVVWTITGKSPISKTYSSRTQFITEAIIPLNQRLKEKIKPNVRAIYAEGDTVIVLWDGRATAKDGLPYNNTYSWYLTVKNGKIIVATAFFDTIDLAYIWNRIPSEK